MMILAYHGSPNKFENFSFEKVGTEGGITGAGFGIYFSTSKADSLTYGENIYTCMLQLKTNVDNHKVTFQPQILKAILDTCEDKKHSYYEAEYFNHKPTDSEKEEFIRIMLNDFNSDTEILADIINECYKGQCGNLLEITDKYGFSHTQDFDSPDSPDIMHYIVYDLDAITIQKVENLKTM
jgi:hypothetical protein